MRTHENRIACFPALYCMGVLFIVSMIVILVGGEWIIRRVKALRREIEA